MDISTALTLLAQATTIVKDLREIDKTFDRAHLKAQMADLYGTLADVKIALSDARELIHEKDKEIVSLNQRIETLTAGEECPLCRAGKMKVVASHEHPSFGFAGVQERTVKCDKCGHSENRMHDPAGRISRKRS